MRNDGFAFVFTLGKPAITSVVRLALDGLAMFQRPHLDQLDVPPLTLEVHQVTCPLDGVAHHGERLDILLDAHRTVLVRFLVKRLLYTVSAFQHAYRAFATNGEIFVNDHLADHISQHTSVFNMVTVADTADVYLEAIDMGHLHTSYSSNNDEQHGSSAY